MKKEHIENNDDNKKKSKFMQVMQSKVSNTMSLLMILVAFANFLAIGFNQQSYAATEDNTEVTSLVEMTWNPGSQDTGTEYKITIHFVNEDGNPLLSNEELQKYNSQLPTISGTDMYLDHLNNIKINGSNYYISRIMYGNPNSGQKIKQDIYSRNDNPEKIFYNLDDGTSENLWDTASEREMEENTNIYIVYDHDYEYSINDDVYTVNWEVKENKYTINVHYVDTNGNTILNGEQLREKLNSDNNKTTGQELAIVDGTNLGFDRLATISSSNSESTYWYDHVEIETSKGREKTKQVIYTYGDNSDKSSKLFYNTIDGVHEDLFAPETEQELEETVNVYVVYQPYPSYTVEDDIYTVKWKVNNNIVYTLKLHFVDKNGNEIIKGNEIPSDAPTITSLTNLMLNSVKEVTDKNGKKYVFSRATIDGQVIKPIIYSIMQQDGLYYNTYSGKYEGDVAYWLWDKNNEKALESIEKDIYLTYSEKLENIPTVETVDSKKLGFNMYMYNFTPETFNGIEGLKNNYALNNGAATQGIYSKTLDENGFPTIVETGESLQKLYVKENGVSANHLFLSSVYNNSETKRTLYYNSFEKFAHFNKENGNFEVYDVIGTPEDVDQFFYSRGNFMPYNTINNTSIKNYNWYTETGTKIIEDASYGKDVYGFNEENDYNFGFYSDATFIQNNGGMYNGKPMKININGDDDILIYIDGILVADLGGVHDAQYADIDLSTGKITWSNKLQNSNDLSLQTTTLKEIFNSITDQEVKEYLVSKGWSDSSETFADNTEHNLKIFYLERGSGASDLKLNVHVPLKSDEQYDDSNDNNNTNDSNLSDNTNDSNKNVSNAKNPLTLDSINIGLLVTVVIISLIGIMLCVWGLIKNRKENKNK